MGKIGDFLFGKKQKPEYLGGKQLTDTYSDVRNIMPLNPSFQYTGNVENQIGNLNKITPGQNAGLSYLTNMIQEPGKNVYESNAWNNFQNTTTNRFGDIMSKQLGQLANQAASKGMLRGSSSERMVQNAGQDLFGQLQAMLGQQGFQAQQAGLNRAMGAAQFLPQMELNKDQSAINSYMNLGNTLAGLQQQGYQNKLSKYGLQGNVAQNINSAYGYPQKSKGLLDLVSGAITNASGAASNMEQGGNQNPFGFLNDNQSGGGGDLLKLGMMAMGLPPIF